MYITRESVFPFSGLAVWLAMFAMMKCSQIRRAVCFVQSRGAICGFQNLHCTEQPLIDKVKVCQFLSGVQLFASPWTVAHQAPLSMEFSRQESWSGQPFPSPGDLPNPGIEPRSPALQADSLSSELPSQIEQQIDPSVQSFFQVYYSQRARYFSFFNSCVCNLLPGIWVTQQFFTVMYLDLPTYPFLGLV